jgi:predicted SAM-dependent methyltransferase
MRQLIYKNLKKIPFLYNFIKKIYLYALHIFSYYKWLSLSSKKEIFINLGSGPVKGKDNWINIDLHGADICCDLRKGIPLRKNSVNKIYSSHMLEHIPFKELDKFIAECYRVLKHGGELSVCVPNARLYIDCYLKKKNFKSEEEMFSEAIVKTGSSIDQLNYIAYLGGLHHYMFDEENLIKTLKLSPFKSVVLRNFDISLDKQKRKKESIYASAFK